MKKEYNKGNLMGINIKDDLYFRMTTHELTKWANLMNVNYSDILRNGSFKKKLYLKVKNHVDKWKTEHERV